METRYIERSITDKILEASKYFPIIVVTGPRQSGKTTLISHIFNDYPLFSLEDLDVRQLAKEDPKFFLNQSSTGMIIDEAQNVPEIFSYIQSFVDNNPKKKFILSGSSNFSLLKSITQSLAGRAAIFNLMPFSLDEISGFLHGRSIDEILYNGFYPRIISNNVPAYLLYSNYIETYLKKDVRDLLKIRDLMQFNTFLKLCAGRIGSLFNASQLSTEVGVSLGTIKSWLSILEASYIITLLHPYSNNTKKRLTKSPKLYFCDTGLACRLLNINSPEELSHDKMRGPIFENAVVMETIKHLLNNNIDVSNLFFYRDSNQTEIDLIINHGASCFSGVEIKSAATFNTSFYKTLKNMDLYLAATTNKRAVVYNGDYENTNSDIQIINYTHYNTWLKQLLL